jgi:hypothetical protein
LLSDSACKRGVNDMHEPIRNVLSMKFIRQLFFDLGYVLN